MTRDGRRCSEMPTKPDGDLGPAAHEPLPRCQQSACTAIPARSSVVAMANLFEPALLKQRPKGLQAYQAIAHGLVDGATGQG